jgi:5-methylcytosine-specific restriction enzyme subunit McrC
VELVETAAAVYASGLIERASASDWSNLGIAVDRRMSDDAATWRLRAGNLVGVAEIGEADDPLRVRIAPKLKADLFALADWAYASTAVPPRATSAAHLEMIERDPAACILAWYLEALESFAVRWLRRGTQHREEVLVGRVRGQIVMSEYVRRHVSSARPHQVPCRFIDTTRDTLPNRILLHTLRHAAHLIPTLELPVARSNLRALINRIEPLFAGVTDQPVTKGDFSRLRFSGSVRHYEPIIVKSWAILRGMFSSDQLGPTKHPSFVWNAPLLFQEALRGLLAAHGPGALKQDRPRIKLIHAGIVRTGGKVDPDFVLADGSRTLLLDAKWKEIGQSGASPEDSIDLEIDHATKIKVGRADIYQAVSYSRHDAYRPAATGLVYPVALAADAPLPAARQVTGFGPPVWILFIDVGIRARSNRDAFFEQVRTAWHSQPEGAVEVSIGEA